MLFDAHNHAFRVLGGVPRRGIYGNMRAAVDKVGRGKDRTVTSQRQSTVYRSAVAEGAGISAKTVENVATARIQLMDNIMNSWSDGII